MRESNSLRQVSGPDFSKVSLGSLSLPRSFALGMILILALIAFEAFNFDTTRYALENLMGDVRFVGFAWATILAIAFCAIDFAGLGRLLTPERGRDEPREIWYLTGAWLLGATMNAIMTWWAVSTVLLSHDLGNEILSREQLLHIVPVFVAILVWLTRILFIGAITMAGERLLHGDSKGDQSPASASVRPGRQSAAQQRPAYAAQSSAMPTRKHVTPVELGATRPSPSAGGHPTRISQRPPRPAGSPTRQASFAMRAAARRRR
jgi:hypothetical protein